MWVTEFSSSAHAHIYECYCFHGTLSLKSSSFHDNSKLGLGTLSEDLQWKLVHAPAPRPQWPTPRIQCISVQNMSAFTAKKNLCMRKGKLATGLHGSFDACINLYKTPASLKPAFWSVLGLVLWKISVLLYTLCCERKGGQENLQNSWAQMYFPRQFTFRYDSIWKMTIWQLIPLKLSMPASPLKVFWYIQGPETQGEHCPSAPVRGSQGIKQGHERRNLTPRAPSVHLLHRQPPVSLLKKWKHIYLLESLGQDIITWSQMIHLAIWECVINI